MATGEVGQVIWMEKWQALSARIDGLIKASALHSSACEKKERKHLEPVARAIKEDLKFVLYELEKFYQDFELQVPYLGGMALQNFLEQKWDERSEVLLLNMAPLEVVRTQFNFYLHDVETSIKSVTELAFEHLRRLIVVSEQVRSDWQEAFKNKKETGCEMLGATHLLLHGIWAFKTSNRGATDLVYQEPIQDRLLPVARRAARGLVLTEWKRVTLEDKIEDKATEARHQCSLYESGLLGGMELSHTRYIVLVTEKECVPPGDVPDATGRVLYRHIVVPVAPDAPSVTARELSKS